MDKTILTRAIEAFGRRSQILKAIEEMAELTAASEEESEEQIPF